MRDIRIGEGDRGNGAVVLDGYNEDGFAIYQNSRSYWLHGVYMGFDMVVFKNTPEGLELKERIDAQESLRHIRKWLAKIIFPRINPEELSEKIRVEIERAERRGRQQKAAEIRAALGE